jgi:glycosyltransferase involved in cell wall biosynthesis
MSDEAALLSRHGHDVEQWEFAPVGDRAGLREGFDVVWNRRAGRDVSRIVASLRPDVVHVHSPYPLLSPVVFRAASEAGAATVTTLHNYRMVCLVATCLRDGRLCFDCVGRRVKTPGVRHRCYHDSLAASGAMALSLATHRVTGTFRHHVHRYLALSEVARDLLVRDGYPADRIGLMANSVSDPGEPKPRTGPFSYAAFVGRLVPEKGIETLLNAWHGLDIPLKIAGDGPCRAAVERAAADNPRVTYLGWLSPDDEGHLLSGADALVFPSRWLEGQPLVLLRAMAHGVPVLCSDIANIEETAVKQGAGRSFATESSEALAAAISAFADDLDAARAMGRAGRQAYVRHHTPDVAYRRLIGHYEQAIATRAERSAP